MRAARSNPASPAGLHRDVDYLQHPLFNEYHSETEMLRYLRRLEARTSP
jgi:glycine dehydrogenase